MKSRAHQNLPQDLARSLKKLGEDLRIARKKRRLRLADLAAAASCGIDTLRRLEAGDPAVSIGVIAMVLRQFDKHSQLGALMDAAMDIDGLQQEAARLPKRVRRPNDVTISAEQFHAEKRASQSQDHALVASANFHPEEMLLIRPWRLRGAVPQWPEDAFSEE
jgi:transcriptional regulator with XRE-family HTH domain